MRQEAVKGVPEQVLERLPLLLEVAVVGQGQALDEHQQGLEVAEHPAGLAAHQLRPVGVSLLRHDAGAGGVAVRQADEVDLGGRPQDELLGHAGQPGHEDGAGGGRLLEVVAGRHRVHGVFHQLREAEQVGRQLPVDGVGGAGEGAGPEGAPVDPLERPGEPLPVAGQGPGVGQQVVAEEHRLAALEVGVAGHQGAPVGLDPVEQPGDQPGRRQVDLAQPPSQPEADVGRDLVVAGSGGVQAAPRLPDQLHQPGLHRHVDVLVEGRVGTPSPLLRGLRADPLQRLPENLWLVLDEQAGVLQHRHVGEGTDHVVRGHLQVGGQRRGDPSHHLVHLPLEPSPEPAHGPIFSRAGCSELVVGQTGFRLWGSRDACPNLRRAVECDDPARAVEPGVAENERR